MSVAAVFISGWFFGVVTTVFALFVGLRLSGDRTDDLTDYGADWPRVDPAFHDQPNTSRERNDHA